MQSNDIKNVLYFVLIVDENEVNSFHENLHKALKSISDKAQDISGKDNVINEDELAKMFLNLSGDNVPCSSEDSKDGGDGILPLMNSIVENLLSKDFLYPTLADLSSKVITSFLRSFVIINFIYTLV